MGGDWYVTCGRCCDVIVGVVIRGGVNDIIGGGCIDEMGGVVTTFLGGTVTTRLVTVVIILGGSLLVAVASLLPLVTLSDTTGLLTMLVGVVLDRPGEERKGGVKGLGFGVLRGILIPEALHSLMSTF